MSIKSKLYEDIRQNRKNYLFFGGKFGYKRFVNTRFFLFSWTALLNFSSSSCIEYVSLMFLMLLFFIQPIPLHDRRSQQLKEDSTTRELPLPKKAF